MIGILRSNQVLHINLPEAKTALLKLIAPESRTSASSRNIIHWITNFPYLTTTVFTKITKKETSYWFFGKTSQKKLTNLLLIRKTETTHKVNHSSISAAHFEQRPHSLPLKRVYPSTACTQKTKTRTRRVLFSKTIAISQPDATSCRPSHLPAPRPWR